MATPFPIIDSHVHYFQASALTRPDAQSARLSPRMLARMRQRFEQNLKERGQPVMDNAIKTPAEYAAAWSAELDRHEVAAAIFLHLHEDPAPFLEFLRAHPRRFIGYGYVNPLDANAADLLEKQVREYGYRGLKLITTSQWFHPWDERCYPLWERAERLRIPVLIHSGVSIGYNADLRFANPLDLQPVLRDFPDLNFILAHFGTGFFREALLLCYQCRNIFLDTSSSNIWMKYQDHRLDLTEVFRLALDAAGPERIIFGTDSSYFPRGFRRDILDMQLDALIALGAGDEALAGIFGGNILRLMGLADVSEVDRGGAAGS